jgi:hypothetical protein
VPTPAPQPTVALTLRGTITSVDRDRLTLSSFSEPILLTPGTEVRFLTRQAPLATLTVGRSALVTASRDGQGHVVARLITLGLAVQHRSRPPSN